MERGRSDRVNLVRAQLHLALCIGITDTVRARALVQSVLRAANELGESGKDLVAAAREWLQTDGGSHAARSGTMQWAGVVRGYSSQYAGASWSAAQALGAPDTYPSAGDARTAWASMDKDADTEWIEVGFDEPERARAIAIYETFNPGAVTLVELVTASGRRTVYRGTAAPVAARSRIQTIDFPCTAEPVLGVRITLGSKAVPGWNEIDAIGATGCR
jgi:hypothetical protein